MLRAYLKQVENQNPDLVDSSAWTSLKNYVNKEYPESSQICIASIYKMDTKKGPVRGVITKENDKTWVMYEVIGSSRPGTRWMLHKTWCTKNNIWRDTEQSYELPAGTRLK